MTLDLAAQSAKNPEFTYTRVASRIFAELDDFEVAWVRMEYRGRTSYGMMTDHDDHWDEGEENPSEARGTKLTFAQATRQAIEEWMAAARLANPHWSTLSPEDAVLDVARRVWDGEWLGQRFDKVIYGQEVARLLQMPNPRSFGENNPVWQVLNTLRTRELVDLNGAVLLPYRAHFRFPEEIRNLITYIVEEPLGWPNGEAGDCALATLEDAITEHTHYRHGRDLVWPHNFPSLSPHHLVAFGLAWLNKATIAAEKHQLTRVTQFDPAYLADQLEILATRLRAIPKVHETPS